MSTLALLAQATAFQIPLADQSVHCVITSPPYWGLRKYAGLGSDQLGLEATPEEYVANLVAIFREVRRVLREDGTVWLNLGDSYAANRTYQVPSTKGGPKHSPAQGFTGSAMSVPPTLKPKDLVGIPWRVAFALQADGWWLRSDIIWAKGISFCDTYSGSVMPESVQGWRWERHRIKVEKEGQRSQSYNQQRPEGQSSPFRDHTGYEMKNSARYIDCPGCPKCEPNDGLVLRRGSWRPTTAHEHVFLLAKSERYFADGEAVREELADSTIPRLQYARTKESKWSGVETNTSDMRSTDGARANLAGRNPRSVWTINPEPYSGAHYACYPTALVEPCIKAGTSEKGVCPECGAPWVRVIRPSSEYAKHLGKDWADYEQDAIEGRGHSVSSQRCVKRNVPSLSASYETADWRPSCACNAGEPIPAIVLDPFVGSGTTCQVAQALGRRSIGLDLSFTYLRDNARERLGLDKLGAWRCIPIDGTSDLSDLPMFET